MHKRARTISINLRLPADLHKKLVAAATTVSPPNSLNSEILARLFESFDKPEMTELEAKVREVEAHAMTRITEVEKSAVTRIREVEKHADELAQRMESSLVKLQELQRRAEAKLK